jgi:phage replication-related protein YjqB (UPF0714/DUF867 family)
MLARMTGKYSCFADLQRAECFGTDYRIRVVPRPASPVLVIAPHGGGIEIGTSELAALIAGEDHSLFVFEGLKADWQNRDLHITSHQFDHPECLSLVSRCQVAIGIHGCKGESQVFVGGLDTELSGLLTHHLVTAGISATAEGHRYPGRNPLNICNRSLRGRGAQLEVTRDLRDAPGRERIAQVVRGALVDYVARL